MFTPLGVLGAVLFVAGPLVAGLGYALIWSAPMMVPDFWHCALIVGGAIASTLAIPMMLVGREYRSDR